MRKIVVIVSIGYEEAGSIPAVLFRKNNYFSKGFVLLKVQRSI